MKVKTITFAMLRKTDNFENDRAEVTVELGDGDDVIVARTLAVTECEKVLDTANDRRQDRKLAAQSRKIREAAEMPGGAEALEKVAESIIRRGRP